MPKLRKYFTQFVVVLLAPFLSIFFPACESGDAGTSSGSVERLGAIVDATFSNREAVAACIQPLADLATPIAADEGYVHGRALTGSPEIAPGFNYHLTVDDLPQGYADAPDAAEVELEKRAKDSLLDDLTELTAVPPGEPGTDFRRLLNQVRGVADLGETDTRLKVLGCLDMRLTDLGTPEEAKRLGQRHRSSLAGSQWFIFGIGGGRPDEPEHIRRSLRWAAAVLEAAGAELCYAGVPAPADLEC